METRVINAEVRLEQSVTAVVDNSALVVGVIDIPSAVGVREYTGDYTFTPTQESQTIPIEGLTATQDITINPIPSNYGLITWDGATLTVS